MKKLFLTICLSVSAGANAAPWDFNIQQYDQFGTSAINRLTPLPGGGANGIVMYDSVSNLPKLATYDSTLTMSNLVVGINPSILASKFDVPTGNAGQYLLGNGSLATFPTAVSAFSNDSGYVTTSGARSAISLTTTGSGAATYNASTGVLNIPTPSVLAASINDNPSRSLVTATNATGFQISATRNARVCYEGSFSTTSTIGGPASASVFLETADTNSTTPSDWTTKAQQTYSNNITLAVVLNQAQVNNWTMCRDIPAGKFVRIRSGAISGTASASINATQQETLY